MKSLLHSDSPAAASVTRRDFLRTAGKGLTFAALASGLPTGWVGGAYASEAPEVADMKVGMIALTDCAPFVIAHEKGFFKKYGIKATIAKQASWAAIRDALSGGTIQATHMLIGMPIASTMGLLGSPKKPMVIPWLINRNGQAITLANKFKGKVKDDPKALKPFVDEAKAKGTPLSFAMTFPPGTHAMWMRYYLGAGGIHPDKDTALITIPPPQMVQNMKIGKMDGFCVGEPWNLRAIDENIGYTSITTQKMWKNHPEKVCAFLEEFADKNPKTVKAFLKALHEASVWLDNMSNRSEACDIVSLATYINCPKEIILERMLGIYKYGDGRQEKDPDPMIFHDRNCNYPQAKYGTWWLSQFRRWGMVEGAPDYAGIPAKVLRADLYEAAMKEIGYKHGGADNSPETLFDGVTFNPAEPEAYAKGFAVNSLKG
jgi:nitrate/nitrite transport system substrate-binding protein